MPSCQLIERNNTQESVLLTQPGCYTYRPRPSVRSIQCSLDTASRSAEDGQIPVAQACTAACCSTSKYNPGGGDLGRRPVSTGADKSQL